MKSDCIVSRLAPRNEMKSNREAKAVKVADNEFPFVMLQCETFFARSLDPCQVVKLLRTDIRLLEFLQLQHAM